MTLSASPALPVSPGCVVALAVSTVNGNTPLLLAEKSTLSEMRCDTAGKETSGRHMPPC